MGKKSRSGSGKNILDHISQSLETIFWVKLVLKLFDDADPQIRESLTLDPGWKKIRIRDKHPVSATLRNETAFSG